MSNFRAFKADLLYGQSGLYKTSNCGWAAKYYYEKYGLTTRWVGADNGGWEPVDHLVQQGIIEAWPIRLWPNKIEALDLACQGYWPNSLTDPAKGLMPPAEIAKTKVGLYVFEGLTSFGEVIMDALRKPGISLSQDPNYVLKDGNATYVGSNMSNYGFVQDRIGEFVTKTHMIPQVKKVLWTALEGRGEDKETKLPVFGPAIEGKKATAKASQWFGNTLHMEACVASTQVDESAKQISVTTEVRMYLRTHVDLNSKLPFPAKIRAPFDMDPKEWNARVPEWMEPRIDKLYALLDTLKAEASARAGKLAVVAVAK